MSSDNLSPSIQNLTLTNINSNKSQPQNLNQSPTNDKSSELNNNDDIETKKMLQELSDLKKKNQM